MLPSHTGSSLFYELLAPFFTELVGRDARISRCLNWQERTGSTCSKEKRWSRISKRHFLGLSLRKAIPEETVQCCFLTVNSVTAASQNGAFAFSIKASLKKYDIVIRVVSVITTPRNYA